MWLKIEQCKELHKGDRIRKIIFEENKEHLIGYTVANKGRDVLSLIKVMIDNIELPESQQTYVDLFAPEINEKELELWVN